MSKTKKATAVKKTSRVKRPAFEMPGFLNLRDVCDPFRTEADEGSGSTMGLNNVRVMSVSRVSPSFQRPFGRGFHYYLTPESADKVRRTLESRRVAYIAARTPVAVADTPVTVSAKPSPTVLEPLILPAGESGMRLLNALSSILDPVISECQANRMLMAQQQKIMLHQCVQLNAQDKLIKSLYYELTGKPT